MNRLNDTWEPGISPGLIPAAPFCLRERFCLKREFLGYFKLCGIISNTGSLTRLVIKKQESGEEKNSNSRNFLCLRALNLSLKLGKYTGHGKGSQCMSMYMPFLRDPNDWFENIEKTPMSAID